VSKAALSKNSTLPAVSVGFAISILIATWVAGTRFERMDRADTQAMVEIQDLGDRQRRYIGTTGILTKRLEEIDQRLAKLETQLALLEQQLESYIQGRTP
tara:strand:- start:495 stop:794 length:300 start_codon:yes stop_codon:yes gene_type:complete